jgi:hypothetical protein
VEVTAVESLGLVLTFALSAEGCGNSEAWNKELVACRASPLPLLSPCVWWAADSDEFRGLCWVGLFERAAVAVSWVCR